MAEWNHAHNLPHIATSTVSENATAAAAVIPIDDPTLTQTTGQEQENADLDDQLLAEMDTSFPQAVQVDQVPQATQVDPSYGVQATQPPATPTLTATAAAAAAAEPAGQQQRKRGRPKGSKDKQPRSRKRVQTGTQAAGTQAAG
ncbi:hypothetical protein V8E54_011324 [Elaphomyces granulatus]